MTDKTLPRQRRICMVVRGRARSHPRVVKQARSLRSAGFRVYVVAMGFPGESARLERHSAGFLILRTRMGWIARHRWAKRSVGESHSPGELMRAADPPGPWRLLLMLASRALLVLKMQPLIWRTRPELLIAQDFNALPASWLASRLLKKPLVYDAHEINVDREGYYAQLKPVIQKIESALIHRCDLVMTTTKLRAKFLKRFYRLSDLPCVFENRPPLYVSPPSNRIRESLGLDQNALVALYQGGMQEGRGLHNIVKAASSLRDIHFVLIGEGHQRGELIELARETGVFGRNLHMIPWVDIRELPEWTGSADIGLQLLRRTSFNHWSTDSNKLFEYGIAGLAVVASDFPEIRRIVVQYGFGVLVDPADLNSIVAGISSLACDRDGLDRMRKAAAENRFALSWDHVEKYYIRKIEEVFFGVA